MRRILCFRIDEPLFSELQKIAKRKKISLSLVLHELLEKGLESLKQLENGNDDEMNHHLEIGASSSIEALVLLRKAIKQTNPEWLADIHEELIKKLQYRS